MREESKEEKERYVGDREVRKGMKLRKKMVKETRPNMRKAKRQGEKQM